MSRTFTIETKPYNEVRVFNRKNIEIQPGITVLVGCNGAGKSTLIHAMQKQLKENDIEYLKYDNLHDGGSRSISGAMFDHDIELAASMICSSEGEAITLNIMNLGKDIVYYLKHGKRKRIALDNMIKSMIDEKKEETVSQERWIFFDAVDSGLSIDNVLDFKEFVLDPIVKNNSYLYVVISANSFEMVSGEQCLDVYNGQYCTFDNYEEYKKFICKTRERKEKRYK